MNELFLLDKKIDLHNGANYSEWQTLRIVKPSMVSVEGEMPDIISVSISQRPKEDSKGISSALSFDLTQREAEDLLIALSMVVSKGVKNPVQERLIGKKVKATPAEEVRRKSQGLVNYEYWEVLDSDRGGELKLHSPENNHTLYTKWDVLLGENPTFQVIEEPTLPFLTNENHLYTTLPMPDFSKDSTVLDKAKDLIFGDRVNDYGKTSDSFKNICVGWKIIFEPGFTPERVGLAMAWLKICRASNDNCEKEDSIIDLAGYAACIEKIKKDL
jgi:hypothetical protein